MSGIIQSTLLPEVPQHISELYDMIYKVAGEVLRNYNPCGFRDGQCREHINCCSGCDHLSKNGCVVKSLYCKLWLCRPATIRMPECAAALDVLANLANRYNFLDYRRSKEETMAKLARIAAFDLQCPEDVNRIVTK
jgi:hypothetical protein